MFFSYFLAVVGVIPFLITVLLISLLLMSLDQSLYEKHPITSCLRLLERLFKDIFLVKSPHKYLYFACLFLLLVFSLIPPGSLKPYCDTPTDSVFIVVLFSLAQSLYIRGIKYFSPDIYQKLNGAEYFGISRFTMAFIAVDSCLALYIMARGMPGDIFGLSSLTAMPLWTVVGEWGIFGLICFFILFAVAAPRRISNSVKVSYCPAILSLYGAVRASVGPAITTAMFVPWNPAISLGLNGIAMFTLDFAFFWLKVSLLQILIFPAIRESYSRIEAKIPVNMRHAARVPLGVAGVIAFYLDYLSL